MEWFWCTPNRLTVKSDGTYCEKVDDMKANSSKIVCKLNDALQMLYSKRNYYAEMADSTLKEALKAHSRTKTGETCGKMIASMTAKELYHRYKLYEEKAIFSSTISYALEKLLVNIDFTTFTGVILRGLDEGNKLLSEIEEEMRDIDLTNMVDNLNETMERQKEMTETLSIIDTDDDVEVGRELDRLFGETSGSNLKPVLCLEEKEEEEEEDKNTEKPKIKALLLSF